MKRLIASGTFLLLLSQTVLGQDWPEFLGPGGSAKSSQAVPMSWSESKNLVWKRDLPGAGSSSPIIVGDRIFVTSFSQSGGSVARYITCVDKSTGEPVWQRQLDADYQEDGFQGYLTEHGYASNTAVSDGKSLFVFFGKGGVHAFDLDGNQKWSRDVGKESSNRQWGSAASLALFENLVLVNAAEESQSILALDKSTGEPVWREEAAMLELAYGTPRIVQLDGGQSELVLGVPGEIWSLDPGTGGFKWSVKTAMTGNVSPSLVVDGSMIYGFGGYRSSGSMAVRAGGKGDVTASHVEWTNRPSSYVATPLLHAGHFYWIDDRGVAFCTSAKDGAIVYQERVKNLKSGRPVYASPILAGEHIYVVTRNSGTLVYSPARSFEPISQNVIASDDSDFNASPAVSEGKLFLRSNRALYCIGS